jgi:hypothetical protein
LYDCTIERWHRYYDNTGGHLLSAIDNGAPRYIYKKAVNTNRCQHSGITATQWYNDTDTIN